MHKQINRRTWEEEDRNWIGYLDWDGKYKDEVSGEVLTEEGVIKARKEEMEEIRKHGVYVKVPIEERWRETGKKPIGTKWVDVNKGVVYIQNTGVD